MDRNYIYLDNNATTKVDEHVLEAMLPYFKEEYANPSSMYDFAKPASRAIKEARGVIKDFINAKDEKEIIDLAFMAFRCVSSGSMAFSGCTCICNGNRSPMAVWLVWGPVFPEYGGAGWYWYTHIWKKLGIF